MCQNLELFSRFVRIAACRCSSHCINIGQHIISHIGTFCSNSPEIAGIVTFSGSAISHSRGAALRIKNYLPAIEWQRLRVLWLLRVLAFFGSLLLSSLLAYVVGPSRGLSLHCPSLRTCSPGDHVLRFLSPTALPIAPLWLPPGPKVKNGARWKQRKFGCKPTRTREGCWKPNFTKKRHS